MRSSHREFGGRLQGDATRWRQKRQLLEAFYLQPSFSTLKVSFSAGSFAGLIDAHIHQPVAPAGQQPLVASVLHDIRDAPPAKSDAAEVTVAAAEGANMAAPEMAAAESTKVTTAAAEGMGGAAATATKAVPTAATSTASVCFGGCECREADGGGSSKSDEGLADHD
jgi:hypothetical protein